ncbi:DUF484 family protein [Sphingomonas morindae]|uniref:DUF484 family protein n=1 Tax=Sphingomonas morindae TaxID=1541170 RepID=A0ABY4X9W1_9SPHN|nr:DUF484 family protein [Sphingomonas morindae]USI73624.1 DUF484 family protein [Sphingomonas morindae]
MGRIIDFQDHAVATLRARVAAVEEANRDLLAYARNRSGAVAAIHRAVLAAAAATGLEHLIHIATQEWPDLLGVDAVAIALALGGRGVRADANGLQYVHPRVVARMAMRVDGARMRGVTRGHPLFGPAASLIRAEALIRLDHVAPLPAGLLVLGQRAPAGAIEGGHGAEPLVFLGEMLAHGVARWL